MNRNEIYKVIVKKKKKYGQFRKCLFHLHTFASHDYRVLYQYRNTNDKISKEGIEKLCIEKELFPKGKKNEFLNTIKEQYEPMIDGEELLVYLLIANELIKNDYELVLVTDHNTIEGYDKLNEAINIVCKWKKSLTKLHKIPKLILGIEISCADKNHIVSIFDSSDHVKTDIYNFISEYVMSPNDGTYLNSREVLGKINEIGGVSYIAHINTSDMFQKKEYLSGAYKKILMESPFLNSVGLNDYKEKDKVKKWIGEHTSKEYTYFIDNDSHEIDTIQHNFFWIKGQNANFNMIKEAIVDSNISIHFEKPKPPKSYIEGIFLVNDGKGFLVDRGTNNSFSMQFSDSLNCFIGGRGTGKSSCLNIIEATLAQRFMSKEVLNAVFSYEQIWLLYKYDEKEYLVNLMPYKNSFNTDTPYQNLKEHLRKNHIMYRGRTFNDLKYDIQDLVRKDCIHVYPIENGRVGNECQTSILDKFFDRSYSVNELVNNANEVKISRFIKEMLYRNKTLKCEKLGFKSRSGLVKFIDGLGELLTKKRCEVENFVKRFNEDENINDIIRLVYSMNDNPIDFIDFNELLYFYPVNVVGDRRYIENTNLTLDGLIAFLNDEIEFLGLIPFMKIMLHNKISGHVFRGKMNEYTDDITEKMINNNLHIITKDDEDIILKRINYYILNEQCDYLIRRFRDDYFTSVEKITLQFNVMKKEGALEKERFIDISMLSLGQKVIAMLTFVLGYSDYICDYRPLVIDQPEDNLDNQYIYKTLVNTLRDVKGKRQVIIATHNATIVTNAKAEEVVVMQSDGLNGWIQATGYPTNSKIKMHIINYLEGGGDSFKHKTFIYKDVLI